MSQMTQVVLDAVQFLLGVAEIADVRLTLTRLIARMAQIYGSAQPERIKFECSFGLNPTPWGKAYREGKK